MPSGDTADNGMTSKETVETHGDAELLQRFIQNQDQAAMEAIVRRHGPLVMGLCRSILWNEHDAADAFQATFLVLLKKARAVGKPASLASWLHGVACRVAKRARMQSLRQQTRPDASIELKATSPIAEAASQEAVGLIHDEIRSLPERFRLPVILCCLEGETLETVAARLGWTAGSVRGRLERGREMLRMRLARRGVALTATMLAALLAQQAMAQVPASLIAATVKASLLIAGGQSLVGGAVSAQAVALSHGVLKAMLAVKLKIAACLILAVGTVATGALVVWRHWPADAVAQAARGGAAAKTTTGPTGMASKTGVGVTSGKGLGAAPTPGLGPTPPAGFGLGPAYGTGMVPANGLAAGPGIGFGAAPKAGVVDTAPGTGIARRENLESRAAEKTTKPD